MSSSMASSISEPSLQQPANNSESSSSSASLMGEEKESKELNETSPPTNLQHAHTSSSTGNISSQGGARKVSKTDIKKSMLLDLPMNELDTLVKEFRCALHRRIIHHGKMSIYAHYICFMSNTNRTKAKIPFLSVLKIKKKKNAFTPTAIRITTVNGEKFFFSHLNHRERTWIVLYTVWAIARGDKTVCLEDIRKAKSLKELQAVAGNVPAKMYAQQLQLLSSIASLSSTSLPSPTIQDASPPSPSLENASLISEGEERATNQASEGNSTTTATTAAAATSDLPSPSLADDLPPKLDPTTEETKLPDAIKGQLDKPDVIGMLKGITIDGFWRTFFGPNSRYWEEFQRGIGDKDIVSSEWRRIEKSSPGSGYLERTLDFTTEVKSKMFKGKTATVHQTQRCWMDDSEEGTELRMMVATESLTSGLPIADKDFTARTWWQISQIPGPERKISIKINLFVVWINKPPFGLKGTVEKGVVGGMKEFFTAWLHQAQKVIDSQSALTTANAPGVRPTEAVEMIEELPPATPTGSTITTTATTKAEGSEVSSSLQSRRAWLTSSQKELAILIGLGILVGILLLMTVLVFVRSTDLHRMNNELNLQVARLSEQTADALQEEMMERWRGKMELLTKMINELGEELRPYRKGKV